ncbi:helicase-exonuclease AddAB subunit AddA [Amphibacillus sediminis]|uniref:helicase-exonuclease AddAB subunit AddA n=1 Tax=Amphibacillus sediminis TaxID=360185 RepID=UPI000830CE9F|nr:helicase-exonuclease AddAB subunit AddA [Amphibacillus sediminis]
MPQWTEAQKQAIETSGQHTLVAAAAGSGKTAVLVERIIHKVMNEVNPVNIDRLLVATFTNAAAQEMRNRIAQALERSLEQHPSSQHLKQQLTLLQQASISTLHAFCLDLVRRHSYLLDLDPGFRIADEIEADLLRQEVLESLFEEWYGQSFEEQEAFFEVVDRFSSDRSDQEVERLLLDLYDFATQSPWPDVWLDRIVSTYAVGDEQDVTELKWMRILKDGVLTQLEATMLELQKAIAITQESDGPSHYAEAIEQDLAMVERIKASIELSWEEGYHAFQSISFKALSRKKMDCSEDKKEQVKGLRSRAKKRLTDMAEQLFARQLSAYLAEMKALQPTILQLVKMVKQFKVSYQQIKKEKGLIDFSDLEHFALALLMDDSSTEDQVKPSAIAKALRAKYEEVLVDEYQDTNMVQETILQLVTREDPGNLFMVGDVKQSIYRFRHAEPSLFITKYKQFTELTMSGKKIELAKNFRSRKEVLWAANFIFRQLLDEQVGEMNYDQGSELVYGNHSYDQAPNQDFDAELVIIDRSDKLKASTDESREETELDLAKAELEGRAYVKYIKKWIGLDGNEPSLIFDKDKGISRPAQYRDIVILLRSMTWAPTIMEELKKQGIPVYAELATGYLSAIEIKVMLNLLKVIDNAKQDIPLASVLRSPIVGLNEDELAQIRLADPKASYYDALHKWMEQTDQIKLRQRLERFLRQLMGWRDAARQGSLAQLIWQIYRETGYYDFVAGMPGGRQRQANLRALYDRAHGYEQTSFRGLFRFLRMIERMEERGEDLGAARALGEQEDVVRITTIHKSKGLEFPIVILGAMDKPFNQQDLRQRYLLHKDYGFASKYIDPINRIMYPTLMYFAIKQQLQKELWAEEMRVLYVALTRAKEKLVMVGTVNDLEKKQLKWQEVLNHSEWVLPASMRLDSSSYMDWIGASIIRHQHAEKIRGEHAYTALSEDIYQDQSNWKIKLQSASDYQMASKEEEPVAIDLEQVITGQERITTESDHDQKVEQRLAFQYRYNQATLHRAKQTVTEIKRQQEQIDENSGKDIIRAFQAPMITRPRFMQQEQRLSAAEKGTAMHTLMQHIPFKQGWSKQTITEFAQSLVEQAILSQEQADIIEVDAVLAFIESELMSEILNQHDQVKREVAFSLMLPARDVYLDWQGEQDEQIFLQGVIDLLIQTERGWIIVDYKTDRINNSLLEKDKLKNRYQTQLKLYTQAVETIYQAPVEQCYLYFFDKALWLKV